MLPGDLGPATAALRLRGRLVRRVGIARQRARERPVGLLDRSVVARAVDPHGRVVVRRVDLLGVRIRVNGLISLRLLIHDLGATATALAGAALGLIGRLRRLVGVARQPTGERRVGLIDLAAVAGAVDADRDVVVGRLDLLRVCIRVRGLVVVGRLVGDLSAAAAALAGVAGLLLIGRLMRAVGVAPGRERARGVGLLHRAVIARAVDPHYHVVVGRLDLHRVRTRVRGLVLLGCLIGHLRACPGLILGRRLVGLVLVAGDCCGAGRVGLVDRAAVARAEDPDVDVAVA